MQNDDRLTGNLGVVYLRHFCPFSVYFGHPVAVADNLCNRSSFRLPSRSQCHHLSHRLCRLCSSASHSNWYYCSPTSSLADESRGSGLGGPEPSSIDGVAPAVALSDTRTHSM